VVSERQDVHENKPDAGNQEKLFLERYGRMNGIYYPFSVNSQILHGEVSPPSSIVERLMPSALAGHVGTRKTRKGECDRERACRRSARTRFDGGQYRSGRVP
jgi:hypothetical protein